MITAHYSTRPVNVSKHMIDRQTDRQTHIDKQTDTDRETDRDTHRQINRQRHTHTQTDRDIHRQTNRERYTQTDRDTHRQTDRQTDRETNRQRDRPLRHRRDGMSATRLHFSDLKSYNSTERIALGACPPITSIICITQTQTVIQELICALYEQLSLVHALNNNRKPCLFISGLNSGRKPTPKV